MTIIVLASTIVKTILRGRANRRGLSSLLIEVSAAHVVRSKTLPQQLPAKKFLKTYLKEELKGESLTLA